MDVIIFLALTVLSLALLILPKTLHATYHFALQLGLMAISSYWAVQAWSHGQTLVLELPFMWAQGTPRLMIDSLSAFFVVVINLTMLTGGLYARGYLRPYQSTKSSAELGWHYFNLFWLQLSLLFVVMMRNAIDFLVAWELMSAASFFLVLFESEKKETVKIAIRYLIQMHVGMVFLMGGFLFAFSQTGGVAGFDGLSAYFEQTQPLYLFMVFFVGFAVKAGFVPVHTWLPQAHPAAPSHVSGMMSGVMIKMGIYGILRVALQIHTNTFAVGLFVLLIAIATGLYGIMNAIVQKDIKKILAFSSIENIGIIGIGIGVSLVGKALGIVDMEALGMAGALLHILNHSLFKSLLFFSAGSVYQQTHTRYIEHLGGLIKRMPTTGVVTLIGVLAISGLPPFNGFVSEFLIYTGLFHGLQAAGLMSDLIILLTFVSLALIGGLAVFAFTRYYSIAFLGSPRHACVSHAHEVDTDMRIPKLLIVGLMLAIGLGGSALLPVLQIVVAPLVTTAAPLELAASSLMGVAIAGGSLVGLVALIWYVRSRQQSGVEVTHNLPWGCGYMYKDADVPLHQYTATSYADNYQELFAPLVGERKERVLYAEEEIFPQPRSFKTEPYDKLEQSLVAKPSEMMLDTVERSAVFQTGKLQHYVLYALAFMVAILLLSVLDWI